MGKIKWNKSMRTRLLVLAVTTGTLIFQNCGKFEMAQPGVANFSSSLDPISFNVITSVAPLTRQRNLIVNYDVLKDANVTVKSVNCTLNGAAVSCSTSAVSLSSLADGDYVLRLNAEDSRGQLAQEVALSFRVDGTAPSVMVSQAPASVSGSTSASFIFASSDALSGVMKTECSLDSATYSDCTSPYNLTSLSSAAHNVKIRATDLAGNPSTEYSYNWTVNTSAPVITISAKPNQFINTGSASFTFSGTSGGSAISNFECQMDGAAFAACTSPRSYAGLSDGNHTFNVRGQGSNGVMSSPVGATFMVDTVVPGQPTLTANVTAITNQTAASLQFSSTDAGSGIASYQCSLDGAAYAACTSPRALSGLVQGSHTFNVRALDNATNTSVVRAYTWSIDTGLPIVTLTANPTSTTSQTVANFTFTVADNTGGSGIASVACQLDTQAYAACTTSASYSGLATGTHAFRVRATDNAGNQQILTYNWTIAPAATSINLAWDPNAETTLAGYKVYYGTSTGVYTQSVDIGLPATVAGAVNATIPNLNVGTTYYFVVVAYDGSRTESDYSNEVNKLMQ